MKISSIENELMGKADSRYKEFHSALIPGVSDILGVRLPEIRKIAKKYVGTDLGNEFLSQLPHNFYDEYMLHGIMIGYMRVDYLKTEKYVTDFLPYIDNWAVCDSFVSSLKTFFKNRESAYEFIKTQLKSDSPYRIRFALVAFLNYYTDDRYARDALTLAVSVSKNSHYYVKMALAWLISVFLVKQYEITVPIIENRLLPSWIHNKSIQKAKESFRISDERKAYLKSLKVKE